VCRVRGKRRVLVQNLVGAKRKIIHLGSPGPVNGVNARQVCMIIKCEKALREGNVMYLVRRRAGSGLFRHVPRGPPARNHRSDGEG
jgi:hypothetical protein